MPAGAGIASIGSSVAGGIIGSDSASKAAAAAQEAAQQDNAVASNVYGQTTSNLNPYIQTGTSAQSALSGLLGIGGNPAASSAAFQDYLGSTNYNFVKNQGEQGVEYANAPSFNSSATAKALDTYTTGLAGNALAGYESTLGGLGQTGESAAGTLGSLGQQYSDLVSSNNNTAAGATASADLASGNYWANALKSITQGANQQGTQSSFGNSSPLTQAASGVGSALSGLFGG